MKKPKYITDKYGLLVNSNPKLSEKDKQTLQKLKELILKNLNK